MDALADSTMIYPKKFPCSKVPRINVFSLKISDKTTGGFSNGGNGRAVSWNGSYWIALGDGDTANSISNIQYSYDGQTWCNNTTGGFCNSGYGIASAILTYLGINCNSPHYTLDVFGTIHAPTLITNHIYYTDLHSISDRRVKTNISSANLLQCYSTIRELPLRRFQFLNPIHQDKQDKKQVGFIADEVYSFFPKAIKTHMYNKGEFSTLNFVNFEQIHMTHFGATQYMASLLDYQNSTIVGQNTDITELRSVVNTFSSLLVKQSSELSILHVQIAGFSNILSTLIARI
jgi:hypothetical protein